MEETKFMISDAAKKVGLESHVLRYWEVELNLPIKRTELGHRYYTEEDIVVFKDIKKLKEQGLQLKAIRLLVLNGTIQNKMIDNGIFQREKEVKKEKNNYQENIKSHTDSDDISGERSREKSNIRRSEEETGKKVEINNEKMNIHRNDKRGRNEEMISKDYSNRKEEGNAREYNNRNEELDEKRYPNRNEYTYYNRNEKYHDNFYEEGEEYLGSKIMLKANEIVGRSYSEGNGNKINQGDEKFYRLQILIKDMIAEVIKENNKELAEEIKSGVLKEMDYQFRLQEEREEEHFKKVDELLRIKIKEKTKRKKHSFF